MAKAFIDNIEFDSSCILACLQSITIELTADVAAESIEFEGALTKEVELAYFFSNGENEILGPLQA